MINPMAELFQSIYQSSNPTGQYIIHDYMRICATATTTPNIMLTNAKLTVINHNLTNQF